MKVTVRIKRQSAPEAAPFWQVFAYESDGDCSVAGLLKGLNEREDLRDVEGKPALPVAWECGCMIQKCGACAMRVNGVPRLACSAFLRDLGEQVELEPLSKFPVVRDLIADRTALHENLKKIMTWLTQDAYQDPTTHSQRYQSAKCLQCGCCLEVCPNFTAGGAFSGAVAAVNAYRILNEDRSSQKRKERYGFYKKYYYEGCGKSLACHSICPIEIPVEELLVRSNAIAIWKKHG